MDEEEYYIIDNGGYVDGPHELFEYAMDSARECKADPDFVSKGNMAIVKVEALLDNFMHDSD